MSLYAIDPLPIDELPGVWIRLGYSELVIGAVIGCLRQIEAVVRRRQDQHGFDGDGWGAHVEGAFAEMAAAKALNLYWDAPLNVFKDRARGDVGPYEVRRRSRQDHDGLVRRNDANDKVHIQVFGAAPHFRVGGWIYGREAKRDEWFQGWGDRDKAWFVPQSELHDLDDIPGLRGVSAGDVEREGPAGPG